MIGRRYLFEGVLGALGGALVACSKRAAPTTCVEAPGLPPDAAQIRANLGYVEPSPLAEKRCDNCRQYVAPPEEGACGSCAVLKGPIHPNGYCKVYGAKG